MRLDEAREEVGLFELHVVRAAGDDFEPGVRDALAQELADGDGADGIGVAEDEQRGDPERREPFGHVGAVVEEPRGGRLLLGAQARAPVGPAQPANVDATRRRREHEAPDAVRVVEGRLQSEDPAHGEGDQVERRRKSRQHGPMEVGEGADRGIRRRSGEPRIPDQNGRVPLQSIGHRLPRRRAPAGPGQEHDGQGGRHRLTERGTSGERRAR